MKKAKLSITELKVKSFAVELSSQERKTAKGGDIPGLGSGTRNHYDPSGRKRYGFSFTDHKSQRPGGNVFRLDFGK